MKSQMTNISTESSRLIAIGDVHGCIHALDALLGAISPGPRDQLIFIGDLIDKGPDSRDVLDRVIELKQCCSLVLIQGNHEEMLRAAKESAEALEYWEACGGVATLNSYRFGGSLSDIPNEHWQLLDEFLPYYETDRFIFTHANYLPDVPMPEQPSYQLRWALFDRDEMQPHFSGKPVFVGHTQQAEGEILDLGFATCIDTACCRNGWLTAIEVSSKQVWQANRWGVLRDGSDPSHKSRLTQLFRAESSAGSG